MTDFLPRHISIMARNGRTEPASSDECLFQRPKRQGESYPEFLGGKSLVLVARSSDDVPQRTDEDDGGFEL